MVHAECVEVIGSQTTYLEQFSRSIVITCILFCFFFSLLCFSLVSFRRGVSLSAALAFSFSLLLLRNETVFDAFHKNIGGFYTLFFVREGTGGRGGLNGDMGVGRVEC